MLGLQFNIVCHRPFYQNESSFGDLFDENVELKNDDVELNNDVYLMLEQISLEQVTYCLVQKCN